MLKKQENCAGLSYETPETICLELALMKESCIVSTSLNDPSTEDYGDPEDDNDNWM